MSWCGARGKRNETANGRHGESGVALPELGVFCLSSQADKALRRVAVSPIRRFGIITCARGLLFYLPDSLHYYGHE